MNFVYGFALVASTFGFMAFGTYLTLLAIARFLNMTYTEQKAENYDLLVSKILQMHHITFHGERGVRIVLAKLEESANTGNFSWDNETLKNAYDSDVKETELQ